MRLRFLLYKLSCGLPSQPRHQFANQQSVEELLANTAMLAGTQGLLLSPQPLFYRQIHLQLLNSPQNVCSALFVPTLQGFAVLLIGCLERASTNISSTVWLLSSWAWPSRNISPPEGSHSTPTTYQQAKAKANHRALSDTISSLLPPCWQGHCSQTCQTHRGAAETTWSLGQE